MKNKAILHVLFFIIIALVLGAAVMLLWNWLMPSILGLTSLSYSQALGLFALSRLLFGGFRSLGRGMAHHKHHDFKGHWKKMSPEQQKAFIERRRKFGFGHGFPNEPEQKQTSNEG